MTVRFGLPLFLVKFINKIQSSAPSPPPTPSYLLLDRRTDPGKADGRTDMRRPRRRCGGGGKREAAAA